MMHAIHSTNAYIGKGAAVAALLGVLGEHRLGRAFCVDLVDVSLQLGLCRGSADVFRRLAGTAGNLDRWFLCV